MDYFYRKLSSLATWINARWNSFKDKSVESYALVFGSFSLILSLAGKRSTRPCTLTFTWNRGYVFLLKYRLPLKFTRFDIGLRIMRSTQTCEFYFGLRVWRFHFPWYTQATQNVVTRSESMIKYSHTHSRNIRIQAELHETTKRFKYFPYSFLNYVEYWVVLKQYSEDTPRKVWASGKVIKSVRKPKGVPFKAFIYTLDI